MMVEVSILMGFPSCGKENLWRAVAAVGPAD